MYTVRTNSEEKVCSIETCEVSQHPAHSEEKNVYRDHVFAETQKKVLTRLSQLCT